MRSVLIIINSFIVVLLPFRYTEKAEGKVRTICYGGLESNR